MQPFLFERISGASSQSSSYRVGASSPSHALAGVEQLPASLDHDTRSGLREPLLRMNKLFTIFN